MTACLDWLAAEYLHRRGLEHDDPPCDHPAEDCPPLTGRPDPTNPTERQP